MIKFTKALEVAVGNKITSTQYNSLAAAFNDRILSGIGDAAWRIIWAVWAVVRYIENDVDIGVEGASLSAPQDAWLRVYALAKPQDGYTWPPGEPGEEEGINLSSPLGWFIYGIDIRNGLYGEDVRFSGDPDSDQSGCEAVTDTVNLGAVWVGAANQRGWVAPDGSYNAPAYTAANSHYRIAYAYLKPYLKMYGGYQPGMIQVDDCGNASETDGTPATPIYQIVFTKLGLENPLAVTPCRDSTTKCYKGYCPLGTPGASRGDVLAGIGYGRDAYYLYRQDDKGNPILVEILSKKEWFEGPYTGYGRLHRPTGQQMDQILNRFARDFRGSDDERVRGFDINQLSFDFQNFFANQYMLAPAYGTASGGGHAIYPEFNLSGGGNGYIAPGSVNIHEGYVLAGVYAQVAQVAKDQGPITMELYDGTGWTFPIRLDPDKNRQGEFLSYFWGNQVKRRTNVRLRLTSNMHLDAGGYALVQLAELLDYKPAIADAYAVLRLGSTKGGDWTGKANGLDTYGKYDGGVARAIWDDYRKFGCIVNQFGSGGLPTQYDELGSAPISSNPIHEAARLEFLENVRLATRNSLVKYEVGPDGKSVLYYRRYVSQEDLTVGEDYPDDPWATDGQLDIFENIAPSLDPTPSGKIVPEVDYVVRGETGQTLTYVDGKGKEKVYTPGQSFKGLNGVEKYNGDARPYRKEGILKEAPPRGESNRWCMFLSLNAYRGEDWDSVDWDTGDTVMNSSSYKPSVHDNFIVMQQRCQFHTPEFNSWDKLSLRTHFVYGAKVADYPEAPSGLIYASSTNRPPDPGRDENDQPIPEQVEARRNFYRSCQIYQAPYEVESITNAVLKANGQIVDLPSAPSALTGADIPLVKIKFTTRLRNCGTAPNGSTDALLNEPYRTDENALRHYLLKRAQGTNCPRLPGDTASRAQFLTSDHPWGCCFPRSYFVRLVPTVYADKPENDIAQESVDTRTLVDAFGQMDFYGRAMSEGYIDRASTEDPIRCLRADDLTGDESMLIDYTPENWLFDAIGQPWLPMLPKELTDTRGYSPLPAQTRYAEIFNAYAKAINILTRARIELPILIECNTYTYVGDQAVTPNWPPGTTAGGCTTNPGMGQYAQTQIAWQGSPPSAGTLFGESGWMACGSTGASQAASFSPNCLGWDYFVRTTRQEVDFRVQWADADAEYALPDAIKDMVIAQNVGVLGILSQSTYTSVLVPVDPNTPEDVSLCCNGEHNNDPRWTANGQGYKWVQNESKSPDQCKIVEGTKLTAPAPEASWFGFCRGSWDIGNADHGCGWGGSGASVGFRVLGNASQVYLRVDYK
jgi:hypothetical protein